MTTDQILQYLAGPGLQVVLGVLLYQFIPDLIGQAWDGNIPPKWRRPVFLVMCMFVPTLAALVRVWFGYAQFDFDALLLPAFAAGWAAYWAGTIATGARRLATTSEWNTARKSQAFVARAMGGKKGKKHNLLSDRLRWDG